MSAVLADTHALIWHLHEPARLSVPARAAFAAAARAGDSIYLGSISLVEIRYLVEKGRIPGTALQRLDAALDDPDGVLEVVLLDRAVAQAPSAIAKDAVPDMPDRIVAATALYLGVPLVTRDRLIRASTITTIW